MDECVREVLPSAVLQSLMASAWLALGPMAQCCVCVLRVRQSVVAASLWGDFAALGRQKWMQGGSFSPALML